MNQELEQKLRKLLSMCEAPLTFAKANLEMKDGWDMNMYEKAVKSLILVEEIKKEIGYKEDKPSDKCKLKNRKLF